MEAKSKPAIFVEEVRGGRQEGCLGEEIINETLFLACSSSILL